MLSFDFKTAKPGYIAVFLCAAVLYITTCAPGVLWQDSGMFQYRIWHKDIEGDLGLALAHPLYHLLGIAVTLVPVGDFAYKVNLISAIAAAITVANIFLLVRMWFGRTFPAVIAAITLGLSWTYWQFASIAEVYTLYTALFTLELLILFEYCWSGRKKFLYLLGFINGLAIANHMWGAIAFGCYFVFLIFLLVRRKIGFKDIGIAAILWIAGALPYEYLIIKNLVQTGDLAGTISSALFGKGWGKAVLNTSISAKIAKENLIFIGYNFATPNIVFLFFGLYSIRKTTLKSFGIILTSLLILFFIFAFRYTVPDRYAFFIPFYCLAAIFVGIGCGEFFVRRESTFIRMIVLLLAFLPTAVYLFVPRIAEKAEFSIGTKREIPYRNDYIWFLRPWQYGHNGPERFATEALQDAEKDAVIIADGTTVYTLWYVQTVTKRRPDVMIFSRHGSYTNPSAFPDVETVAKLVTERKLYVVSPIAGYCPDFLLERYNFVKTGVLWQAVRKEGVSK